MYKLPLKTEEAQAAQALVPPLYQPISILNAVGVTNEFPVQNQGQSFHNTHHHFFVNRHIIARKPGVDRLMSRGTPLTTNAKYD